MSNHGCCAAAGMLLLPHGIHLHPSCAPACLAGTWLTTTWLLHAARRRRQRGVAAAVLVIALFVKPIVWAMMRILTGFSFAGMYIVCESWLNDKSTNETRGQMLSLYMIVSMGGMSIGQMLVGFGGKQK